MSLTDVKIGTGAAVFLSIANSQGNATFSALFNVAAIGAKLRRLASSAHGFGADRLQQLQKTQQKTRGPKANAGLSKILRFSEYL
jgi:hypothetical protein